MTDTIGRFRVIEQIAVGGSSTVYAARDPEFSRDVAVKLISLDTAGFDHDDFERECKAIGSLSDHDNIVDVFERQQLPDGRPYLVMPLYPLTLQGRLSNGPIRLEEVLQMGVELCGALERAHRARVLHRDIKPLNIFIAPSGKSLLGDFGIAAVGASRAEQPRFLTLHYAPPEVLNGQAPNESSDIYSLGASLYAALAGRAPYAAPDPDSDTRGALQDRILNEDLPRITEQQLPSIVDQALELFVAKRSWDRPKSAEAMASAIQDLQARLDLPVSRFDAGSVASEFHRTTPVDHGARPPEPSGPRSSPAAPPPSSAPTDVTESTAGHIPTSDYIEPGRSMRPFIAAGVLLAVLAIGGVLALTLSGGSDPATTDDTPTPTPTAEADPDVPTPRDLSPPRAPTDVTLTSLGDDRWEVSWEPSERAETYRIDAVAGFTESWPAPESPTEIEIPTDNTVCLTVVAVGADGRTSPPSEDEPCTR